jgi:hypothetical protein
VLGVVKSKPFQMNTKVEDPGFRKQTATAESKSSEKGVN